MRVSPLVITNCGSRFPLGWTGLKPQKDAQIRDFLESSGFQWSRKYVKRCSGQAGHLLETSVSGYLPVPSCRWLIRFLICLGELIKMVRSPPDARSNTDGGRVGRKRSAKYALANPASDIRSLCESSCRIAERVRTVPFAPPLPTRAIASFDHRQIML